MNCKEIVGKAQFEKARDPVFSSPGTTNVDFYGIIEKAILRERKDSKINNEILQFYQIGSIPHPLEISSFILEGLIQLGAFVDFLIINCRS